ncbi:response regulator receiver modulated metal dependent phosphohydrolase [Anaeromyxobacter sp. K]|uniref:Response regulator receiver modulated metal dependent phosphohydrolase n=1 Tax=Anaeromyxobacter dehalogenans (strain ATCC BAA-258 / DSM 21875 / 2CP-1) TaxID=455488 RepID=B8J936_ANAD2|nr:MULTISPECIES: HD domain-containing phosphohydrolase [Anaeromyxobacter]ACG73259.1 response regulator receiver modulated metal dependent phosphohydrolase [Anaeromyxobacter sp. K]ACL65442.1 response regulator receiver modulated metal dependent phosphohydrolase [Anaeromyxobacter dehalogenans 2CP-1]
MTEIAPEATRILIVDDDAAVRDVITVLLREEGYVCTTVASAEAALDEARKTDYPLVISDVRMPARDGFWLLEQMREASPDTAVIMLTAYGDTEAAVECLRNGAADYLLKPPKVTELIRAIERALGRRRLELARGRYRRSLENRVKEKTAELSRTLHDLESTYSQTLWTLVAALDAREHETSDHSQRVVRYTLAIARRVGLAETALPDVGRGALLHDIGKIGVPDAILLKPGKLTPEEWTEMRKHPQIGFNILKSVDFLQVPAEMVLCHQERFDGGGYPRGLSGDAIPLSARIFAIADCFDAMTSDRPYRKRTSTENARKEILRCAGTQFDPRAADAFLSLGEDELLELSRPSDERPI